LIEFVTHAGVTLVYPIFPECHPTVNLLVLRSNTWKRHRK
jgi:hypothetical protein